MTYVFYWTITELCRSHGVDFRGTRLSFHHM